MMLAHKILYHARQTVFVSQLYSVGHMGYDYSCALFGRQRVVGVHAVLVLGKESRIAHLANVVVQRAGTHQLYVGAYVLGGIGGQIAHGHRMVECAGAIVAEFFQQRVVDVGQFYKGHHRHESEYSLHQKHHHICNRCQSRVNGQEAHGTPRESAETAVHKQFECDIRHYVASAYGQRCAQ